MTEVDFLRPERNIALHSEFGDRGRLVDAHRDSDFRGGAVSMSGAPPDLIGLS